MTGSVKQKENDNGEIPIQARIRGKYYVVSKHYIFVSYYR